MNIEVSHKNSVFHVHDGKLGTELRIPDSGFSRVVTGVEMEATDLEGSAVEGDGNGKAFAVPLGVKIL